MLHTNAKEVIIQLHSLANEMNLPIENRMVVIEWCRRGNSFNDEIEEKVISLLYSHPDNQYHSIQVDENGRIIKRKKTKNSEWEIL